MDLHSRKKQAGHMRRQIPNSVRERFFPFNFPRTLYPYHLFGFGIIFFGAFCLTLPNGTAAQTPVFPDKIHGYKVHRDPIALNTGKDPQNDGGEDAFIKMSRPELKSVALTGITFELSAEILSPRQSAKIDFLTFHEMSVNGVAVTIEDYRHPFPITRNDPATLPKPAAIMLPTVGILHAAWKEMSDSQEKWRVTGRVFVFGRFRKMGFYHKRVIPVDIDLLIDNPLIGKPTEETEP